MRTADHLLQVLDLDPGVTLGGGERAVAEQRLDVADVGPAPEQVGRDTVPEGVTGDAHEPLRRQSRTEYVQVPYPHTTSHPMMTWPATMSGPSGYSPVSGALRET